MGNLAVESDVVLMSGGAVCEYDVFSREGVKPGGIVVCPQPGTFSAVATNNT